MRLSVPCLAALCLNNQDAKDEVRDLWTIPSLVGLLSKASHPLLSFSKVTQLLLPALDTSAHLDKSLMKKA